MDEMTELHQIVTRAFAAGTSISNVCKRAGIAPSTVTRWKKRVTKPNATTLKKLSDALDEIERQTA